MIWNSHTRLARYHPSLTFVLSSASQLPDLLFLPPVSTTSNCQYANSAPPPAGLSSWTLAQSFDRYRPRAAPKSHRSNRRNRRAATTHWCLNRPSKAELLVTVAVKMTDLTAEMLRTGSIKPRCRELSFDVSYIPRVLDIVFDFQDDRPNAPDSN